MKVLLIQARFDAANANFPPLGLLSLATVAQREGHRVAVLDGDLQRGLDLGQVVRFAPDVVGFSVLTAYLQTTLRAVRALRPALPDALFCAGGVHPTGLPRRTLDELGMDFVVLGEGEATLCQVLARLRAGERGAGAYVGVQGLAHAAGGTFVREPDRPLLDVTALPIPRRDLLDFPRYLTFPGTIKGRPMRRCSSLLVSRGCPHDCAFCSNRSMWRGTLRLRTPAQAVDELVELHQRYGVEGFYFADNLLTGSRGWVLELCKRIEDLPFTPVWACNSRVDTITDELARAMARAGCVQIDFGIESASRQVLDRLGKQTCPEQAHHAFGLLRRHGIRAAATFILGTPGETTGQMRQTYRLARRLRPDHTTFHFLTPYPGTRIYEEAISRGWLPRECAFDETWVNRQAQRPQWSRGLGLGLDARQLTRTRNRYNRHFLWRNHANRATAAASLQLLAGAAAEGPALALATGALLRTRNASRFVEDVARITLQGRHGAETLSIPDPPADCRDSE